MTRSNARELAAHLIYELDYTDETPLQAIETRMERGYYDALAEENAVYAERPNKKQMDYIRACVLGVAEHKEELDGLISKYAIGWNLRLAIFEILYVDDVPTGVAINECVELTRKYEEEETVAFVNGILGSFARGRKEQEP